ncbi:Arylsulfatase A [Mariniphaga anaerophila]|uniref:Arylsulfatase A n=1 Tax=Mariniphaga anaerophila TaxID=1484053 RepID=A0A1M5CWU4_9BACT|nr:arylsulfatase [Mariniphaga anaerophila]SHF59156.1 Arylsulfatase A [Mariniphaga anaerophila]
MNKSTILILISFLFFTACTSQKKQSKEPTKPNIVYILADDLGYGDLSCYGQKLFQTPNIDKLAQAGLKFTQHYSGSTVCAPSRSSLMTGQHTGHTFIRGNKEWKPEGQYPMEAKAFTLAEALQEAGYTTGAFGKWGLGYPGSEGDPNNQGFSEFYGYNCQRLAHNYYPSHLWENQQKVPLEENSGQQFAVYAPELIHQKALQFIEKNKEKPFFMFYPNVIPHAELLLPEENLAEFRGKLLPENEFKGAEPGDPNFREGAYGTQPESHAAFAAMVTLLDKQVGDIVAKLKELGIYENTVIMFTSDNGPHMEGGADPDFFNSNGIFKGYKRDLYEGGIRVPMIAVWDERIAAGTETGHPSAFWDVFPTVAEIAGISAPENTDGVSFLPTLLGKTNEQKPHDYLYWEFHERGGRKALRKGDWKLINYNVFNPEKTTTELYNIADDPGEQNNVAEAHPEIVEELKKLMNSARTESEVFTFESKTIIQ